MKDLLDNLLKRLAEAMPNPIELTDKELALLEAMLETSRDKLCLSKILRAKRGDRKAQQDILLGEEVREFYMTVILFNKKLKGIKQQAMRPAPAGTAPDTAHINDEEVSNLTSTQQLALQQYVEAKKHIRQANPTDVEVYKVAKKMGEEGRLPGGPITVSSNTWTSYISRARNAMGQLKNTPRTGRIEGTSGSIVSYDQF